MNDLPFSFRLKEMLETGGLKHDHPISQARLSKELNITRQAISSYLNSATLPTIDKLKSLAEYFGVTADYLIGLSDAKHPENSDIVAQLGLDEDVVRLIKSWKKLRDHAKDENTPQADKDFAEKIGMCSELDMLNLFMNSYTFGYPGLLGKIAELRYHMTHAKELDYVDTYGLLKIATNPDNDVALPAMMITERNGGVSLGGVEYIEYLRYQVLNCFQQVLTEILSDCEPEYQQYVNELKEKASATPNDSASDDGGLPF